MGEVVFNHVLETMSQFAVLNSERRKSTGDGVAREDFLEEVRFYLALKNG